MGGVIELAQSDIEWDADLRGLGSNSLNDEAYGVSKGQPCLA